MNCTNISKLLSTYRWSNGFCAPRRIACSDGMFSMRLYLHHLDIDGATVFARHGVSPALTIYFDAVIYTPPERHGAAILARQSVARALNIFLYGRLEQ